MTPLLFSFIKNLTKIIKIIKKNDKIGQKWPIFYVFYDFVGQKFIGELMKYFIGFLLSISFIIIILFCPLQTNEQQYLRIHIRANSNSVLDQNVKYKVKDEIVDFLIPYLSQAKNFGEAKKIVKQNFDNIESVANSVLERDGFSYKSSAKLENEYFPTRVYDDIVLEEGNYDALIVNLGSGEGNNWWCLIFPAYCFTKSSNSDKVEYISLIWEIIKNVS